MKLNKLPVIVVQLLQILSVCKVSFADNELTLDLGCFRDNTTRRVTGHYFRDGNLNIKQCVHECRSRSFVYAALEVGIECFCGNSQTALIQKIPDIECNFYCYGEKSKRCGGNWRYNLFSVQNCEKVTTDNEAALYLGCFKEAVEAKLVGHSFKDTEHLTPDKCIKECQNREFLYAGLLNGVECYCGSQQNILEERTSEDECNVSCNDGNKCGGELRVTLYSVGKCEQGSASHTYLGCYKDYFDRRLTGHFFIDSQMTPRKCAETCKSRGFFYAGLQVGTECWCGNQRTGLENKVLNEECNTYCPGDKSKRCGAVWRNTIYSTSDIENLSYRGCYKDDSERKINGQHFVIDVPLDGMTPAKCLYLCGLNKFMYAGLQLGVNCYCGNQQLLEADKVSDSECNFGCTGDYAKKCGGNFRNTVYITGYTSQDIQNIQRDTAGYLGCYKDGEDRRFNSFFYKSEKMTPEKCINDCRQLGYLFAAVQAGSDCFCGDTKPSKADQVNDGNCNTICFGDYSRKCGARWRNSVYPTAEISAGKIKYKGCFMDIPERRLTGHYSKEDVLTQLKCVQICLSKGFYYAGMQAGFECFCGNKGTAVDVKLFENDCNFDCNGDKTQKCGGLWRNSVFTTGIVPSIDVEFIHMGCYKPGVRNEGDSNQDFGSNLTPTICIKSCMRHGYPFAALHLGTLCKCFTEPPTAENLMNDNQCVTRCTGDQTKICGGIDLDSVYETGFTEITFIDFKMQFLGCYNNETQDFSRSHYFTNQKMSVGMCVLGCEYDGYLYARISKDECQCADKPLKEISKVNDDMCNLSCPGDADNICGGIDKQSVYKTENTGPVPKVADFGVKHLGCFKDQIKYSALRAYIVDYQDQLDPKRCVDICSKLGFKYTGLLAGSNCLCGNSEPVLEFMVSNHECNMRCTGEKESICGGNARVTVYKSTVDSINGEIDIRSRYLGCYRDKGDPRALRGAYKHIENLTPWKCVKECKKKNYLYAGLQAGSDCFCGDQHPQLSQLLPDASCNFPCFGDDYRFCGGNLANTIYHTSSMGSEARVAEIGYRFLGCYRDQENPRQLSSYYADFEDKLTPLLCVELCKKRGYYYAGLQYGNKCFCGDNHPIPLDEVEEIECNSKCTGDVTKLCGGNRRNLIYTTKNNKPASPQKEGLNYLGCYKDEESQRHLQGYSQDFFEELTPIKCIQLCKERGYIYAGLQSRKTSHLLVPGIFTDSNITITIPKLLQDNSFCNCGDQFPSPSDQVPDTQCDSRCTGETSKTCGGIIKNYIYSSGYSGPTSPIVANVGYQYIGCFKLQTPIQLSAKSENFNESLTPNKCVEFCKQSGHLYCGLHYSTWCYCGDSSPPISDKVSEGDCSSKCLGDVSNLCGGPNAFTGYMTAKSIGEVDPACKFSRTIVNGGQTCKGSVVFEETFSKPLSRKRWSHVVEVPNEWDLFASYNSDSSNSYTAGGRLIIKPSIRPEGIVRSGKLNLTDCTAKPSSGKCSKKATGPYILPPVQSAQLTTRNSFSFQYGKVEIIAKLPLGDWIVPEIWLLPKVAVYGTGFFSGQINIAMSRGNRDLNLNGNDLSCRHLECGLTVGVGDVIKQAIVSRDLNSCWHDEFHNFTLLWTPDNMVFFIDGEENKPLLPSGSTSLTSYLQFSEDVLSVWQVGSKIAPFDSEFYLHLGLSVGGIRNFPDGVRSNGRIKKWNNKQRAMLEFWLAQKDWEPSWVGGSALEVQYIKVTSI